MAIRDLIPTPWFRRNVPIRREGESDLFLNLRREMNRLFDEFFSDITPRRFTEMTWADFPTVDVEETDRDVRISAELPGIDEKDIDISISDDVLTLKGEKKQEREEKGSTFYRMERSYGSFRRDIPLPSEVDPDKAEAVFKRGVLTIKVPKKPEAQRRTKKIEIKAG
ncbi:MAG: Hsp20/alpha crystallin family protein [Calditrichia bacterium]